MSTKNMLSVVEASEILGLSAVRVRKLCREGRLGQKAGAYYVIEEKELLDFQRKFRKNGRPKKDF